MPKIKVRPFRWRSGPKPSQWSKMVATVKGFFSQKNLTRMLIDPHYLTPVCIVLFLIEVVVNIVIIEKVNYTEIDWKAYMQEVEGFLNGTLDYSQLKGDTGPLVYPAGFVYIYSALYYVTSQGKNVHLAQYIFLVIYLMQTLLVQRIFRKTAKVPPYALVIATLTSYRMHSLYVLRLFNDPIAVLLFYVSFNLFMSNKWILGSFIYSLAVSVKMNILLYAPCLLIAYLTNLTYLQTFINLAICGFTQLVLGLPFLYENWFAYLKGSFDLGRVFEHKWTVNYRFLDREHFEHPIFHLSLLLLHMLLLILFVPALAKYLSSYKKLSIFTVEFKEQVAAERKKRRKTKKLNRKEEKFLQMYEEQLKSSGQQKMQTTDDVVNNDKLQDKFSKVTQLFVLPFFVTNLIGVICARSLHYQFYSWYFHSLLYLVFCTEYKQPVMFLLLAIIEYCWNVYPSTNVSSMLLHFCHVSLLVGVYRTMRKALQ